MQRVVDKKEERDGILKALHEKSGHRGNNGTWKKVSGRYWWDGLYEDCKKHVKECPECEFRDSKRYREELYPTFGAVFWEKVGIDIVHMPMNQGKKSIVGARDDLSEWPEARALAKADSAS